jgi:hypothetical protein
MIPSGPLDREAATPHPWAARPRRWFDPSLPFYLGRPVVMVGYRSELGAGIAAEPYKFIDTVEEFSALWLARPDGYAVMTPRRFDELERSGLPMRVLARDSQRVIVSR